MTLKEFIEKYKGRPVDFDGVYPNQCMDLMHTYVYNVLGLIDRSLLSAPSAYMVYTNFRWENDFTKIKNTPLGVPRTGDIIVWGQDVGEWGHIAIFVEGGVNSFRSFDSNWPVNSLPHIQDHDYRGVLGWLRPKDACGELKDALDAVTVEKDKYKEEARISRITIPELKEEVSALSNSLKTITAVHKKLVDEDKVGAAQLAQLIKDYDTLAAKYKDATDGTFKQDEAYLELQNALSKVQAELDLYKEQKLKLKDLFELFLNWIIRKLPLKAVDDV